MRRNNVQSASSDIRKQPVEHPCQRCLAIKVTLSQAAPDHVANSAGLAPVYQLLDAGQVCHLPAAQDCPQTLGGNLVLTPAPRVQASRQRHSRPQRPKTAAAITTPDTLAGRRDFPRLPGDYPRLIILHGYDRIGDLEVFAGSAHYQNR